MARYKTGTKERVLKDMATYAIRDQEWFIECLTPTCGEPDESARAEIELAEKGIEDFKRMAGL